MSPIRLFVAPMEWVESAHISGAVLHIHGGMAVLFLARVITRRSLATPLPLTCALAAGLLKEFLDFQRHGFIKPDTPVDIINTVLWPTVLFIGLRVRRARELQQPTPPRGEG